MIKDQDPKNFSKDDFQKATGISAATLEKCVTYEKTLREWNKITNLVGDSTLPEIWHRHFMDSAQLFPLIPDGRLAIGDIGSGAGFPGLVLAIIASELRPELFFTLIERNIKKAKFCKEMAEKIGLDVDVTNLNLAEVDAHFDVLTARAVADTGELLELSKKIRKPSTIALFLKGKNLDPELENAQKSWDMDIRRLRSCTSADATVLRLTNIRKRP